MANSADQAAVNIAAAMKGAALAGPTAYTKQLALSLDVVDAAGGSPESGEGLLVVAANEAEDDVDDKVGDVLMGVLACVVVLNFDEYATVTLCAFPHEEL